MKAAATVAPNVQVSDIAQLLSNNKQFFVIKLTLEKKLYFVTTRSLYCVFDCLKSKIRT